MEASKRFPRNKTMAATNEKMTNETRNFRKVARQVMLANMFTRRKLNVQSQTFAKKAAGRGERLATMKTQRKHGGPILELKPPLKRRGTPELFPMSDEMKQTVISLGKMDLLPSKERQKSPEEALMEKSRKGSKFRDKTRRRIVHPQRFIRNIRSSINNSEKNIENGVHREEIISEEDINDYEDSQENKKREICNDKVRNDVLPRTKLVYNDLSRPLSTESHPNAKLSEKSQYFPSVRRTLCLSGYSDLGPRLSTRAVRRTRSQGTWRINNAFPDLRVSFNEQHYFPTTRQNKNNAWITGSAISRSTDESVKNKPQIVNTRRWKSVENLTREIEEKCLSWLETRYGMNQ